MSSIGALGGDCTIPGWAVRPGAVTALRPVGEAMLLWQIIASINGARCAACFASEDALANLLPRSRGTLRRRLESLRAVPGLLLEVKRPRAMPDRLPTVFRWATDPLAVGKWYYCITNYRLPALAEEFGLDGDWLLGATKHAAKHCTVSKALAEKIKLDLFKSIPSVSVQYGEGKGEERATKALKAARGPRRPRVKGNGLAQQEKTNDAGGAPLRGRDSVREDAAVALPRPSTSLVGQR